MNTLIQMDNCHKDLLSLEEGASALQGIEELDSGLWNFSALLHLTLRTLFGKCLGHN